MLTLAVVAVPSDRDPSLRRAADAGPAASAHRQPAPDRPGPSGQGDGCSPDDRTRFADCRSVLLSWTVRSASGEIIGTVRASFTTSEEVAPDSRDWTARYTARFSLAGAAVESGTTAAVVAECRGDCAVAGIPADPPAAVGDGSVLTGDIPFTSPGPATSTSRQVIDLRVFHPAAAGNGGAGGGPAAELGPVRCDDAVANGLGARGRPGCVLPEFVPTFHINSPEFTAAPAPQHAAFVARAQADPKTRGWGRPGSGRPLIREFLGSDAEQRKKRQQVCSPYWPRDPSPDGTPPGQRDSCDEYPFSSTRQGVPEYAVTGHVPSAENSRGGTRLSEFYARYHILDGDAFYVQP